MIDGRAKIFIPAQLQGPTTRVSVKRFAQMANTVDDADGLLAELTKDGDHVFGLLRGQCSMIDLALSAMGKVGAPVDLTVWTWVVADYELQYVNSLLHDERVSAFRLLVDQGCLTRRPGFIESVRDKFGADAVRVSINHAKLAMVRGPAGDVLLRGSMNFNANRCFEQFDVTWSFDLCEWFEGVMDDIWAASLPVTADLSRQDAGDLTEGLWQT